LPCFKKRTEVTACPSVFHGSCLKDWLGHKQSCPLCRTEFEELGKWADPAPGFGDGSGVPGGPLVSLVVVDDGDPVRGWAPRGSGLPASRSRSEGPTRRRPPLDGPDVGLGALFQQALAADGGADGFRPWGLRASRMGLGDRDFLEGLGDPRSSHSQRNRAALMSMGLMDDGPESRLRTLEAFLGAVQGADSRPAIGRSETASAAASAAGVRRDAPAPAPPAAARRRSSTSAFLRNAASSIFRTVTRRRPDARSRPLPRP